MAASGDGSGVPPPNSDDLEAAKNIILCFDSSSPDASRSLFDDRGDADRYLNAVDTILRHIKNPAIAGSPSRTSKSGAEAALQAATARLEDEFRNVLVSRANEIDFDSHVDLSSLSISSSALGSGEIEVSDGEDGAADEESSGSTAVLGATVSIGGASDRRRRRSCSSMRSIREIELLSPEAVQDLRSIAERMVDAGCGRSCALVYANVRKAAVDRGFGQLGVERLSIGDVQRIEWDAVEAKIRKWIRAARICVRVVFASERWLFDRVFDGIPGLPVGVDSDDSPFMEAVKGPANQLLGFADAISGSGRTPEKLFKILDLHDALSDLLPDVASIFSSKSVDSVYTQAVDILSRLADAARGILSDFENAVLRDPSKTPVPGGTIHPLTRYVMNYLSLISDYRATLLELIVTRPAVGSRLPVEDPAIACPLLPDIDVPELDSRSPLASHLIWIIAVLQYNLESKSKLYKDIALSHIFLMNNVHYIVNKVKGSPELREMIGDDYLRKLTGKFRYSATSYQRASWVKVLHCLRDEGIHASGSFSSGVSKSVLRDRFKTFNTTFDEVHRTQSAWSVPDEQLSEELRISISEKLLPAYRSFLGRFRQHIESGRHPEMYIKYSVEDLEIALSDFFEGIPPSALNRRRLH